MAAERDFSELPDPVWDSIAKNLDIPNLVACCGVCTKWNSLLSTDKKFWKAAFQLSGLKLTPETFPKDCGNWREYAVLIMRRLRQMRNSECFRESGFTIDRTDEDGVNAIYYYKNKLAVAIRNKVEMWSTSPERLLFKVHWRMLQPRITSVKFDDLYIMVRDSGRRLRSFDVSTQEKKSYYESRFESLISYDFESAIDIVVGSYMNAFYIWELSSGRRLKRISFGGSMIVKVKMVLICKPERLQKGVIYLFAMGVDRLLMWTITFDSFLSGDGIECSGTPIEFGLNTSRKMPRDIQIYPTTSLLIHGRSLYFPESSFFMPCEAIGELNLKCFNNRQMWQKKKIKNLLAVGEKYIAYHTADVDGFGAKVHVIEISSNKIMATYEVPDDLDRSCINEENDAVVFCDRDWLDGLDLTNDRGVLLAYIRKDKKVCFVKWIPRHELAS